MKQLVDILGPDFREFDIKKSHYENSEFYQHSSLNELLKNSGLTCFDDLEDGGSAEINSCIFSNDKKNDTTCTIRKMPTRNDSRFWIHGLKDHVEIGHKLIIWPKNKLLICACFDPSYDLQDVLVDNIQSWHSADLSNKGDTNNSSSNNIKMKCDFLTNLSKLQQSGKDSISTPRDWSNPPLLNVDTPIDAKIEELTKSTTENKGGKGEWFFMIGSPGNGKSAFCGKYFRKLQTTHDFKFHRSGVKKLLKVPDDIKENEIPYKIEVHKKGESFASCWIIQDASVLKSIYSNKAEPAIDLLDTMSEALEKGVSLIVCTNRGVLETAYNELFQNNKRKHYNKIFSIIRSLENKKDIEKDLENKSGKGFYKKVDIKFSEMDSGSLLIGSDIFEKLIDQSIKEDNWKDCRKCSFSNLCPLLANRETLYTPQGKDALLKLLRRAEALRGEVIVFRTALSILSFILSGCAKDQGKRSPCEWVKDQLKIKAYFNLLTRRVYYQLFCPGNQFGLEIQKSNRDFQVKLFKHFILDSSSPLDPETKQSLALLTDNTKGLSVDVGTKGLLGNQNGILPRLDPANAPLDQAFHDKWLNPNALMVKQFGLIGDLEKKCGSIFEEIQGKIENSTHDDALNFYRSYKTWRSSFTIRIGGFIESISPDGEWIDQFIEALRIAKTEKKDRKSEDRNFLNDIEGKIKEIFYVKDEENFIQPNKNFKFKSAKINHDLKITGTNGDCQLVIKINNKDYLLSCDLYLWIRKQKELGMIQSSVPTEVIEMINDIKERVSSTLNYSTVNDVDIHTVSNDIDYGITRDEDYIFIQTTK